MLEAVGHPRAVNPDRALRRIPRARPWPVLAFGTQSALTFSSRSAPTQGM